MSPEVHLRRRRLAFRLTTAALVWSLGVLLTAVLVPGFDETTSDASGLTVHSATFVEVNGVWGLVPTALPVLACLVVALALSPRGRLAARWAWLAVGLVGAVALVTILSVGVLLVPVAVALTLALGLGRAVAVPDRHRPARRQTERL